MGYDWNTRKKLEEDYKAQWRKKNLSLIHI